MKYLNILLFGSIVMFLVACGGGGGGFSNSTTTVNPGTSQAIAIDKIKAYADDNALSNPIKQDYLDAGVVDVTQGNVNNINNVVASLASNDVDTTEKIQNIVDDLGDVIQFLDLLKWQNDDVEITITYDENNNRLTDRRDFASDNGSVFSGYWWYESEYSYNFDNKTATEIWEVNYGRNASENMYEYGENMYTYNEDGIILGVSGKFFGYDYGYTLHGIYTYDELGNIKTFAVEQSNGFSILQTYDSNGNLLKYEFEYTSTDRSWNRGSETYDSNGNLLIRTWENSDGSSGYDTRTYDKNGILRISEQKNIYADGSWSQCIYTYGENGYLINETCESGTA